MAKMPSGFVDIPPTIQIRENVVRIQGKYVGGGGFTIATSVSSLERFDERVQRALARYGAGDTDIVVDQ